MRSVATGILVGAVLTVLVLAAMSGATGAASAPSAPAHAASLSVGPSAPDPKAPAPSAASFGSTAPSSLASTAFDQRVHEAARALAAAGVPAHSIRLPYVGPSAQVVDGTVVPGPAVAAEAVSSYYSSAPAPAGVAYYGENDTAGTVVATTLNASSVAGSLTVNQVNALYLDVDTPDMWGIQLNAVLGNVTLHGVPGNEFWVQNAVDVFEHNDTINLGEDTWNFSGPSASIASDTSTILSHSSNGSVIAGLYIGEGPWIHAPLPFTLTLYVNSSVTASHDQELWYNYSVVAAGGVHESGNYDWVVFNSGGSPSLPIAPFVADGTQLDPVGSTNDFELDFGIGAYNGANMDVLSANMSATLDYCPVAIASCAPGEFRSVPAAEDFGGETGETSVGLSVTFNGTTASATGGPCILRGLWGFGGAEGASAGATAVTNAITVTGAPDSGASPPYVFVFLSTSSSIDGQYEWAPDVPVWHLAPGTYHFEVLLADYAQQLGSFVVGTTAMDLPVDLPYDPAAGVYTPLWALANGQLAGISTSGNGTVASQYVFFNNPTSSCTNCGGAGNDNLSGIFASHNDYLFPTFPGILLVGTDAYVDINATVSFTVYWFAWGLISSVTASVSFDLQIEFVSTEHVTLAHDGLVGGWPAMFETQTLAGLVSASENPFPQASVMVWNSSHDLVMQNDFVPTPAVPAPGTVCFGVCPAVICNGCVSPDGLLLYGGSANTVWGNTFSDPTDPAAAGQAYAGLAEAESGDLLYNNNFSIDNPTVYLPFDIYTDACPDGYAGQCGPLVPPVYADAWNVSSQLSANVSATVNGFPLSGNVLGLTCPRQGGNFWNDYGNALNPVGVLPFVNRYNYSQIVSLFPSGSSEVQASLRAGGDDLPLTKSACQSGTPEPVRFHASGLPAGALWQVTLGGSYRTSSTTRWINVSVDTGFLEFTLGAPAGFGLVRVSGPGLPTYTSANISGPTTLTVKFGGLETLAFDEATSAAWPGLPANTSWGVTLTPTGHGAPPSQTQTTTGTSLSFSVAKGASYRFAVSKPVTFAVKGGKGGLTVPAHAVTKLVRFRPYTANVAFAEHGLPAGTNWSVAVTPTSPTGPAIVVYGTSSTLKVALTNGSYSYTISAVGGDTPSPSTGTFTVSAPHLERFVTGFS